MTRSTHGSELLFDPEIEKSCSRLRKEAQNSGESEEDMAAQENQRTLKELAALDLN